VGRVFSWVEGRTGLLTRAGAARRSPMFDLEGAHGGDLDAPYGTNLPHPQLVPAPDGAQWLVTFDGTQYVPRVMGYGGHGDVVVMRST
jgi:hypothetical protein